jgi:hypothetical protein
MAWLGTLVSAVIIFFSGIVGISNVPMVVPADTLHTARTVQESAATTSDKDNEEKRSVARPASTTSLPVHTAELPVCPSTTATNCRHVGGTDTRAQTQTNSPAQIQLIPVQKPFQFTRLPFDIENVGAISPLGDFGSISRSQTGSGHPYGNERHFIWHKNSIGRALYNVYAPGDGTITALKMTTAPPYGPQYQLYFRIDDKRTYYIAHINKLDPALEAKISRALGGITETNNPTEMDNSIAVKAGDILGLTGATPVNWDWGLTDDTYSQGITDPAHYTGLGAGHARSVYDLSSDKVKAQLRQLSGVWNSANQTFTARIGEPPLGILGSDVKGTLSGTWFQTYDFNPYPHVAIFSPYSYDTGELQIMLEIPDLDIFGRYQAAEVHALGNATLDPTSITPSSGIVGYYLKNGTEDGVLMVRVNADETITIEATKGIQTLPANATFSSRAITLKR